jgi:hypothetical protein
MLGNGGLIEDDFLQRHHKTKFAGFGAGYVGSKKRDFKKEV